MFEKMLKYESASMIKVDVLFCLYVVIFCGNSVGEQLIDQMVNLLD
jgi:hypothetical protein